MREFPVVYVVLSEDAIAEIGFYHQEEAIQWCKDRMVEQGLEAEDWDCYYEIDKIEVK